jgi:hypothetical protein
MTRLRFSRPEIEVVVEAVRSHMIFKSRATDASRQVPPPLVRGADLLELGMTPGPRIGELLHALQTAQLEGEIKTRSEAFNLLKTLEPTLEIR